MYSMDNTQASVMNVQSMLRTLSYEGEELYYGSALPPVPRDGIYGQQTADAVYQFQAHVGLTPTGRVDYETHTRLFEAYEATKAPSGSTNMPSGTLSREDAGEDVVLLHQLLSRFDTYHPHYYRVPRGQYFSTQTEQAVRVLQHIFRQAEDGRMTPRFFRTVYAYLQAQNTMCGE